MKTAVSIPDDVFKGAERLARRTKKSRSQLYSDAVREYVLRHSPDQVTEAMNRVCDAMGSTKDRFVSAAARRTLERSEWFPAARRRWRRASAEFQGHRKPLLS